MNKDMQHLALWASEEGWDIAHTPGGHLRWTHNGVPSPVFSSSTPSDCRAIDNLRANLVRAMKLAQVVSE